MAYGLRAWAAAGPYQGALFSPRDGKDALPRDRFGDSVLARARSDAMLGDRARAWVADPLCHRSYLDDADYRPRAYRLDDPVLPRRFGLQALDDPLDKRSYLNDALYRRSNTDTASKWDDPLYGRPVFLDDFLNRHGEGSGDNPMERRPYSVGDESRVSRAYWRSSDWADPLLKHRSYLDSPVTWHARSAWDDSLWRRPTGVGGPPPSCLY